MKGKPLLPTLRTKKRYVVYEALSDSNISHQEIVSSVIGSYRECFGRLGFSESGLMDTRIAVGNRGILKINNKNLDKLRISLSMIKVINNKKVTLHTVGVSGIMKKAKENYFGNKSVTKEG